MQTLFSLYNSVQQRLIPFIEENVVELSDTEKLFVQVVECVAIDKFLEPYLWIGNGRKPLNRKAIALAFIAKVILNLPTTRGLINYLKTSPSQRQLCGWEDVSGIPSESTFSRAFAQFSKGGLPSLIHEAMLKKHLEGKLVFNVSHDSTSIDAREKPAKKAKKEAKQKKKRGRPKKTEQSSIPEYSRLDLQVGRSLNENLKELPCFCNVGAKKDSKGNTHTWIGYKLHLAIVDGDIPIAAVLTCASTHDSQVGIPLIQMSHDRVQYCYDLADSAYDAPQIRGFSRLLGHVPIIDKNKRRGKAVPMEPIEKVRYKQRSSVERGNSGIKDNFGARFLRVRGAEKVMCHLMFGVVVQTAIQLLRLVS